MSHPTRLAWLPLATRDEAVSTASSSVGHSIAAIPEFRRDPMVDHIPQHVGAPAVLNQPERIPAKLKIVAALIDAIGPMAFDVDTVLHVGNQLINSR
mgnify:CR=1 FL=1